jgi:hypothetical protein
MIVYSNSCSFGRSPQSNPAYSAIIAESLSAVSINRARGGSCNRRIIRTSLRDLLELKQKSTDKILVLIGLSFFFRTELWQPNIPAVDNDGNFHPINVNTSYVIKTNDYYSGDVEGTYNNTNPTVRDYYRQWLLHESKEALITELITDIVMFSAWCRYNDIKCLIWNNASIWPALPEVNCNDVFLKSLSQQLLSDSSVINPWEFSFIEWAQSLGHIPYDAKIHGKYGHPGSVAHVDLAQYLLTELDKRNQL